MATAPVKITANEKNIILIALDLQFKSLERAKRAAKGAAVAAAYETEAAAVNALIARIRNGELEI